MRTNQDRFFLLFMNGDCLAKLGGQRSKPNTSLNLVVNKKQPLVREKVKNCLADFYPPNLRVFFHQRYCLPRGEGGTPSLHQKNSAEKQAFWSKNTILSPFQSVVCAFWSILSPIWSIFNLFKAIPPSLAIMAGVFIISKNWAFL